VDADYIADMRDVGTGRGSRGTGGVAGPRRGSRYGEVAQEAGYDSLSLSSCAEPATMRVTKSFILRAKERIRGELSLSEIIRLRDGERPAALGRSIEQASVARAACQHKGVLEGSLATARVMRNDTWASARRSRQP